ncbi:MAG: hypothetical protein P8Y24_03140 [Gammaproteobacteria bacterium]
MSYAIPLSARNFRKVIAIAMTHLLRSNKTNGQKNYSAREQILLGGKVNKYQAIN